MTLTYVGQKMESRDYLSRIVGRWLTITMVLAYAVLIQFIVRTLDV